MSIEAVRKVLAHSRQPAELKLLLVAIAASATAEGLGVVLDSAELGGYVGKSRAWVVARCRELRHNGELVIHCVGYAKGRKYLCDIVFQDGSNQAQLEAHRDLLWGAIPAGGNGLTNGGPERNIDESTS